MNIKSFFTNLFTKKKSRIELLEEKIAELEKRIFKEKKTSFMTDMIGSYTQSFWGEPAEPKALEEDFFDNLELIQDQFAALVKHLGVEMDVTEATERKFVVKKLKVKK